MMLFKKLLLFFPSPLCCTTKDLPLKIVICKPVSELLTTRGGRFTSIGRITNPFNRLCFVLGLPVSLAGFFTLLEALSRSGDSLFLFFLREPDLPRLGGVCQSSLSLPSDLPVRRLFWEVLLWEVTFSVVEVELSASTRVTSTLGEVRGTSNPESLWTVVSTFSGNNCLNSISTEPKSVDKSKVRTGLNNNLFTLLYLCRGFNKVLSRKAINFHSQANLSGFNLSITKNYLVVLMAGSQNFVYSWPICLVLALNETPASVNATTISFLLCTKITEICLVLTEEPNWINLFHSYHKNSTKTVPQERLRTILNCISKIQIKATDTNVL